MPDPMDELEHFTTPGLTMDPLPAAEVRRRGTRMRRRNQALATIGGIAAVAVIATPLALAANRGSTDSTPPPATQSPSASWVTQFPSDFDVSTGLPANNPNNAVRDSFEKATDDACDGEGWAPDDTVTEVRQAVVPDTEGGLDRIAAAYETEPAAAEALSAVIDRVQQCATNTAGKGRTAEVLFADASSFAYADHFTDGGDTQVYRVVRIGNALLVDSAYTMGGGDPQVLQHTVDLMKDRSAAVEDAMCVFGANGC